MCPTTDCVGENISYPDVQSREDMIVSSPMKIHGKKGSNGTRVPTNKHFKIISIFFCNDEINYPQVMHIPSRKKSECATKYPAATNGANLGILLYSLSYN